MKEEEKIRETEEKIREIEEKIKKIERVENEEYELSELRELKKEFEEFINDIYPPYEIGNATFTASEILNYNRVLYETFFSDWLIIKRKDYEEELKEEEKELKKLKNQ